MKTSDLTLAEFISSLADQGMTPLQNQLLTLISNNDSIMKLEYVPPEILEALLGDRQKIFDGEYMGKFNDDPKAEIIRYDPDRPIADYWIDPASIQRYVKGVINDRTYSDMDNADEKGEHYKLSGRNVKRAIKVWRKNKAAQSFQAARFPFLVGDLVIHPLLNLYATIQEIEVCGPLYSEDGLADLRFAVCLAYFENEQAYKQHNVSLSFHIVGPDHWWLLTPVCYRPETNNAPTNGEV